LNNFSARVAKLPNASELIRKIIDAMMQEGGGVEAKLGLIALKSKLDVVNLRTVSGDAKFQPPLFERPGLGTLLKAVARSYYGKRRRIRWIKNKRC
jgi:hypothetical protein